MEPVHQRAPHWLGKQSRPGVQAEQKGSLGPAPAVVGEERHQMQQQRPQTDIGDAVGEDHQPNRRGAQGFGAGPLPLGDGGGAFPRLSVGLCLLRRHAVWGKAEVLRLPAHDQGAG